MRIPCAACSLTSKVVNAWKWSLWKYNRFERGRERDYVQIKRSLSWAFLRLTWTPNHSIVLWIRLHEYLRSLWFSHFILFLVLDNKQLLLMYTLLAKLKKKRTQNALCRLLFTFFPKLNSNNQRRKYFPINGNFPWENVPRH